MSNTNKPYPPALQAAIDRYRRWAKRPLHERDAEEEAAAFAELDDAAFANSYETGWVMHEEQL